MILEATSKKPRCSSVDASGEVFFVAPRAREEEERDQLEQLRLWKHAGYDTAPSYVSSSSSSKRETSGSTDTDMITEARKRTADGAYKAYMECAQLLALTDMINTQEHMTLLTCSRPGIAETRGLKLPPGQLIELRRQCFEEAEKIIDTGFTTAQKVIQERRLYANGLQCLQRHWKLLNRSFILSMKQTQTSGNKQSNTTTSLSSYNTNRKYATSSMIDDQLNSANVYHEMMYVDCSYVRYGDSAITAFEDYLVPLVRGPTGPILPVSEINRVCQTLQIEIIHRTTGCVLAATTAWKTCRPELLSLEDTSLSHQQSSSSSNASTHINNTSMTALHHHCLRRKHECMSKRILGRLSKGAMDNHDRWIVLPNPSHPTHALSSSQSLPTRSTLEQWLLGKDGGNIIGGIELSSVERGKLEVNITDDFLLRFSLVPIPTSSIDDVAFTDGPSDEPCVVWLEELLARSMLKSRILLLSHWAATAATAVSTTKDKDKATISTTTIVSGSNDSNGDQARVPLTLTAAISKLRHPLLAHPHRNVGNSGASHLSGPGSENSLRQSTASGRILLALLDVLRCGLRTQSLITTLATMQHTAMNDHETLGLLTPVDVQFQCIHTPTLRASGQGQGQGLPATESSLPQWSMVSNKHEFWNATTLLYVLRDESEITMSFSDFCMVLLRVTSRCGVYVTSVVEGKGRSGMDSLFHPISTQFEPIIDLESFFHSLLRITAVASFLVPLRQSLITVTATSPHIILLSLQGIPKQTTLMEGVCEGLLATLEIDQSLISTSNSHRYFQAIHDPIFSHPNLSTIIRTLNERRNFFKFDRILPQYNRRTVRVNFAQDAIARAIRTGYSSTTHGNDTTGIASSSGGKGGKRKSPAKSKSKETVSAVSIDTSTSTIPFLDPMGTGPMSLNEGQMMGFVEFLCHAFPIPSCIFDATSS